MSCVGCSGGGLISWSDDVVHMVETELDPRTWADELLGGPKTFDELAALTSGDTVAAHFADVLVARPELVRPILVACAQWAEQMDRQTWRTTGFTRMYR